LLDIYFTTNRTTQHKNTKNFESKIETRKTLKEKKKENSYSSLRACVIKKREKRVKTIIMPQGAPAAPASIVA